MNLAASSVNGSKFESRSNDSCTIAENGSSSVLKKDTPRSLNDYKFSVSPRGQDTDSEILDLDVYDLTDDDESWLYSSPSGKMTYTDISEWLRKDADNLDPITRRALAVKLEAYLRRKGSAGSLGNDSFDGDALKQNSVSKNQSKSSSGNVVQKQEPVLYTKSVSPSKTFIHSSDNQKKSGDHLALSSKNSDLNPDIKDIQLLASMQEQDLRNCLQQMNLTNRRRMTPENHDRLGTSPKTYAAHFLANGSSNSTGTSPKFHQIDLAATYVKPGGVARNDYQPTTVTYVAPKSSKIGLTRKISTPGDVKKLSKVASLSTEPQYTGLRKSLPNLAASRSGEFSLPITDSNSEKGSCGDVSVGMTPSSSSQRMAGRLSSSKLATPSRIPTALRFSATPRSGIPVARSRAKSPAPKMSLQTRYVDRCNWNDGCI